MVLQSRKAMAAATGYNNDRDRLAMWVWASDLKTKANIDAMIAFASRRMTDLFIFAIDDSVSPKTWLGTGTLGASNATSIDGKTPWAYTFDAAHAAGIKVHAWLWLGTFSYWGGTTGIDTSIPNNATYNDAGVWNFHDATARTAMVNRIADFVSHNNVDGLHFNLESTTANITVQDHTDFFTELQTACPSLEFSLCVGASIADDTSLKFDTDSWLSSNLIDTAVFMGYYDDSEIKSYYVSTLGTTNTRIMAGLGAETNLAAASDFRHKWLLLQADNYQHYSIFCWGSNLDGDAGLRNAVSAYLTRNLAASQPTITKVSVTPGTSFTLTIGGADQTTNYADVTDHVYHGPLKRHIEAAVGSENPAVIYYRDNSTTTRILIGDFEP